MTNDEFWTWWNHYAAAFPGADAKLGSLKDAENLGGKRTLKMWADALSDVKLEDALEVNRQMVLGGIPAIRDFEIGTTPGIVRKHAKELAHRRAEATKPPEEWERDRRPRLNRLERSVEGLKSSLAGDPGMKAALETVLAMKAAGRSPKAIRAALEQMFPPDPTDRRDRFRCLKCQDTGLARVWSEVSIRAVMGGTIDEKKNQRQATVPCDCNTGHAKIAVSTDLKNRTGYRRRFDPKLDLVCRDPHHPDEIEQLVLWVENVTGVSRKKPEQKPVPERGLFDELIPGEVIDAEFEILPEEHDPDLLQQMEEFGDA